MQNIPTEAVSFFSGVVVGLLPKILDWWHGDYRETKTKLDEHVYNELYKETELIKNGDIPFSDGKFYTCWHDISAIEPKYRELISADLRQDINQGYSCYFDSLNELQEKKEGLERANAPYAEEHNEILRRLSPTLLSAKNQEDIEKEINRIEQSAREGNTDDLLIEYIETFSDLHENLWEFLNREENEWSDRQTNQQKYWGCVAEQRDVFHQLQENSQALQDHLTLRLQQSVLRYIISNQTPNLKHK
ncbi:hypothetical protein ACFR97_14395 [Haloplanus litoreus]|uniref:Uncharacterized protein n=1 Tax=Haloplanus litoreus TaxID=767515 RepID=A0ABD5ZYF8_9EURY